MQTCITMKHQLLLTSWISSIDMSLSL